MRNVFGDVLHLFSHPCRIMSPLECPGSLVSIWTLSQHHQWTVLTLVGLRQMGKHEKEIRWGHAINQEIWDRCLNAESCKAPKIHQNWSRAISFPSPREEPCNSQPNHTGVHSFSFWFCCLSLLEFWRLVATFRDGFTRWTWIQYKHYAKHMRAITKECETLCLCDVCKILEK